MRLVLTFTVETPVKRKRGGQARRGQAARELLQARLTLAEMTEVDRRRGTLTRSDWLRSLLRLSA